jgi:uncharacterized membrane protein (UPF0127 family)
MERLVLDRLPAPRFLAALAFLLAASVALADPRTRLATVKVGQHPLRVEVVAGDADRARGLMHRTKLGADEGMLFIFDEPAYHSMWMKDTLIPLSVAFIDAQGAILNILDMEPQTLDSHMSAGPSIYAIEVNKGWFAAKKVRAGDKVTGLPKKK